MQAENIQERETDRQTDRQTARQTYGQTQSWRGALKQADEYKAYVQEQKKRSKNRGGTEMEERIRLIGAKKWQLEKRLKGNGVVGGESGVELGACT